MFNLTKRQEAILYCILESKSRITVRKAAAEYHVSERTIHYDMEYINSWLKDEGGLIRNSKSNGIYFVGSENAKKTILEHLFQNNALDRVYTQAERLEYVIHKLLLSSHAVTSEELAEALLVSRPTVLADLKKAEQQIARLQLKLLGKKGCGYWLEGSEPIVRDRVAETLKKVFHKKQIRNYDSLYSSLKEERKRETSDYDLAVRYIRSVEAKRIYELLNHFRREKGIAISDADSLELFLALGVTVKRLKNNCTIAPGDMALIKRGEEAGRYGAALEICDRLESEYGIECNKSEISYVCRKLIGCNAVLLEKTSNDLEPRLDATVNLMLQSLWEDDFIHLPKPAKENLRQDLHDYLNLLVKKRNLNISSRNPLLAQIIAGYPMIHKGAEKMAELFYLHEGILLTIEETAAITTYIAAYADTKSNEGRNRVLLVSNEGKGLSMLLRNRVKNNIPELKIKDLVSVYELNQNADLVADVDFIISTVELPEASVPVFCVNPIISQTDIRNISGFHLGSKAMGAVDRSQEKDNYLKNVLLGIMSKYMNTSQLDLIIKELDYFLAAHDGVVTEENAGIIKEEYAYRSAMIIAKLSEMFWKLKNELGRQAGPDMVIGLAVHVTMSISRWEKRDFYPDRKVLLRTAEEERIYLIVDQFLTDVSEVFQYPIGKGEAYPVMRYLL